MMKRCAWSEKNDLMREYHDTEWGVPIKDNDLLLFEHLCLEVAQAGLNWNLVLQKRENYRKAFDDFDFMKIKDYDEKKIVELMKNKGIIRNLLKIKAFINNAKCFHEIKKKEDSFSKYVWSFVENIPIINDFKSEKELPVKTLLSEKLSKDLKKRGFKFVGPIGVYAFLQTIGLVNDHVRNCFKYGFC